MRTTLIALGATCALATGAVAADLPIVEPVYAPAYYDWNGFYAGINLGFGGGTFEHPFTLGIPVDDGEGGTFTADLPGSLDVTAGGWVGGIQAGYNWQFDSNWLFGIEADIQASSIDGRATVSIGDPDGGLGLFDEAEANAGTSLDWFGTIRPRIGWVDDRFVVYATGGLAWGQTTSSVDVTINGTSVLNDDLSITNDRMGWTIGAGIEYALTDTVTFKTEYLWTDLGSEEIVTDGDVFDGVALNMDSDVAFSVVRAGLNFQF